jgi:3'(2'), 5'-bisphosphate nucleotidase
LKTEEIQELLKIARDAAIKAGIAILKVYQSDNFGIDTKADNSPLTLADKNAHEVILQYLKPTNLPVLSEEGNFVPYEDRKKWLWYWLVDPLDGTKEFLKRNGEFTVNIALMHVTIPVGGVVYAPDKDLLFYGSTETGVYKIMKDEDEQLLHSSGKTALAPLLLKPKIRVIASRSHLTPETIEFTNQFKGVDFVSMGSSLKMLLLAENKADIYPRFAPTMEWDTAAAHALLRALGKGIYQTDLRSELIYNKPDLLNPSFIAF